MIMKSLFPPFFPFPCEKKAKKGHEKGAHYIVADGFSWFLVVPDA